MNLTEKQEDTLKEILNIAFARAAASLSTLSGHRVILNVPQVAIAPIDEVVPLLKTFLPHEIASVHQIFSGTVAGDALLILSYDSSIRLAHLLVNGGVEVEDLELSDRELLTEMGNIVLNACLGVFGNLLQIQVIFSVPRLHLETLEALLDSITIGKEELQYALIIYTNFRLRDSDIQGYLVIVLGVSSMERLLESLEKLG